MKISSVGKNLFYTPQCIWFYGEGDFFFLRLADYGDNKIHVLKRRNDYKCKITFLLILIKFYIICIIIGRLQGLNINKLSYSWMVGKLSNINISSSVFFFLHIHGDLCKLLQFFLVPISLRSNLTQILRHL